MAERAGKCRELAQLDYVDPDGSASRRRRSCPGCRRWPPRSLGGLHRCAGGKKPTTKTQRHEERLSDLLLLVSLCLCRRNRPALFLIPRPTDLQVGFVGLDAEVNHFLGGRECRTSRFDHRYGVRPRSQGLGLVTVFQPTAGQQDRCGQKNSTSQNQRKTGDD